MLVEHIGACRSLSIIGMCKNAGKTTVLNRLIYELRERGTLLALTSIGRDGESVDVVTGTGKPGIYVYENTLVATARDMLALGDISREIIGVTDFFTPLGDVVLLRARSDGSIQLAGPSMTAQLAALTKIFDGLGAELTIIDGAISRKSLCAPAVSETTILCTGASYSRSMAEVVEDTAFATLLLTLPRQTRWEADELACEGAKVRFKHADGRISDLADGVSLADAMRESAMADVVGMHIRGAVTSAMLKPLVMSSARLEGVELSAGDGSKLLFPRDIYDKLIRRGMRLAIENPVRVAAVTINPFSAYGFDMDGRELLFRMRESVAVPVVDVENDYEEQSI